MQTLKVMQCDAVRSLLNSFHHGKEVFDYPLVSYWDARNRSIHGVHLDIVVTEETVPRVLRDDAGSSSCSVMR